MKVFFDTGAFIAFFIKEEVDHQKVKNKYLNYLKQRAILFTSDYILDELYTRLIYDFDKNTAIDKINTLSQAIASEEIKVLTVDEYVFKEAKGVLTKFAEHKISFTDATTYVLCKNFAIDEIFTLDKDFKRMRLATSF